MQTLAFWGTVHPACGTWPTAWCSRDTHVLAIGCTTERINADPGILGHGTPCMWYLAYSLVL